MTADDRDEDPFVSIQLRGRERRSVVDFLAALRRVGVETVRAGDPDSVLATRLGADYPIPNVELIERIVSEEIYLPLAVPSLGIPRRFSAWGPNQSGNVTVTIDLEGLESGEKVGLLRLLVDALPPAGQLADVQVRLQHRRGSTL